MASLTCQVIGNWKMNGSRDFVTEFFAELGGRLDSLPSAVKITLCPPFTLVPEVAGHIANGPIRLGAQDMSGHAGGAYTGDVSAAMLLEWGVQRVILGHSERRAFYGETDAAVAQKALTALEAGLQPVICVGETASERSSGRAEQIVGKQLAALQKVLSTDQLARCLIAYEPIWAIGTGDTASPQQAQAMHAFIREHLQGAVEGIVYGGSVNADNAAELFAQPDIQGGLVGGASLKANEFIAICHAAGQSLKVD